MMKAKDLSAFPEAPHLAPHRLTTITQQQTAHLPFKLNPHRDQLLSVRSLPAQVHLHAP